MTPVKFCSYLVLMLQILLTRTEIETIEWAFGIAFEVGGLPDPAIDGDDVRISVLRDTLRKAREKYLADSWWGSKAKRDDREK